MRLVSVEVEGYRSFNQRQTLHCDAFGTVILAANDHGKTNLLDAITHLNTHASFEADRDLHWDMSHLADRLPRIKYELQLDAGETHELQKIYNKLAYLSAARVQFGQQSELYADLNEIVDAEEIQLDNVKKQIAGLEAQEEASKNSDALTGLHPVWMTPT